jgi:hypothetical protein
MHYYFPFKIMLFKGADMHIGAVMYVAYYWNWYIY